MHLRHNQSVPLLSVNTHHSNIYRTSVCLLHVGLLRLDAFGNIGLALGLLSRILFQPDIVTYRIFSNLIRTSFCRFLKRKKKKVSSRF